MPWSKDKEAKDSKNKGEGDEVGGEPQNKGKEWRRLRMIEAGEVNGVRFPPGIIIDVNKDDGEKLIASNKAEYVDTSDTEKDKQIKQADSDEKSQDDTKSDEAEPAESEASGEKSQDDTKSDDFEELSNGVKDESKNNEETKDKE